MARYLADLRASRAPARTSATSIPGTYPAGHPADDDDWETVSTYSRAERNASVPPTPVPRGVSYQGGQTGEGGWLYPSYVGSMEAGGDGGVRRVSHPFDPFAPM